MKNTNNRQHWIFGLVLLLIGALMLFSVAGSVSLAQWNANANLPLNVNVNNVYPTASGHVAWQHPEGGSEALISTPLETLTGVIGGYTNVIMNVNVTDENGYAYQTINVQMRLLRTDAAGADIVSNVSSFTSVMDEDWVIQPRTGPVNCVDIATVSDVEHTWRCVTPMWFTADSTVTLVDPGYNAIPEHWTPWIQMKDGIQTITEFNQVTYEWPGIVGLGLVTDFVHLGQTDAAGTVVPADAGSAAESSILNKGNTQLDKYAYVNKDTPEEAWSCVSGNPLISDLHMDSSTSTPYASMTPLTNSGSSTFWDLDFDRQAKHDVDEELTMGLRFATNEEVAAGLCTMSNLLYVAAISL